MQYLLNLGLFYIVVIPAEKKYYILNVSGHQHEDIQSFLSGETIDFSKYDAGSFKYNDEEYWTSFQDKETPKTYLAGQDINEDTFFEMHYLKKHSDGILLAIKDPNKDRVKVFKKNLQLQNEEQVLELSE